MTPDLNPLKNLWGILQPGVRQRGAVCQQRAADRATEVSVQANITRATLELVSGVWCLVSSAANRISKWVAVSGEYIGK